MILSEEHFTEVFSSCRQDVFNVAFSYLKSVPDAENIVQETFSDYYQRPPLNEKNIRSWLVCKAMHKSIDLLRKKAKESEHLEASQTEESTLSSGKEEDGEAVRELVRKLPKKYRDAIVLFYFGESDIKQIAKALMISKSAAKKRLERGRKILKEEMKDGTI
jgi:RNA polymerase sigma-70 factor (ECF subfamily)